MKTKNVSVEDLSKLFRKAYVNFYLTPRVLFRNLKQYAFTILKLALKSTLSLRSRLSKREDGKERRKAQIESLVFDEKE